MTRRSLVLLALASMLATALAAQTPVRPKIMLTGYWPPSNEAVRQFSPNAIQNPAGWVGSDWEGRGYDIYSYFPEFTPPTCTSCGAGTGDLTVDYQDTSADFWALADAVKPIAIITFSRTSAQLSWEMEMNQFNRTVWVNDYVAPLQPTRSPPDASVPAGFLRPSTLPVQNVVNDVIASGLPVSSWICFTGNGGGFLSEFIAYHGVWYQAIHESPTDPAWCIAAGHVHVGSGLSWTVAKQAAEVTLRTVIAHVDNLRAATICQTNIGFQGPGPSMLSVCGGSLGLATSTADVRLSGAAPNTIGVLGFGTQLNPIPLFGGVIVPLPTLHAELVVFDAQGFWLWEDGLVGMPTGLPLIYAQAAYLDSTQIEGWGISNAVELSFL